jgi:signal transduction histidine kinase
MRPHRHRHAPPWWPDTEPWPPSPEWPPSPGAYWERRGRFFRYRMAGVFGILLPLAFFGGMFLLRSLLGSESHPPRSGWVWWWFVPFLVYMFVTAMRRVGRPLGDVVAAAERVASGDFAARVRESGPPWLRSVAAAFNSMTSRLELQQKQRRDLMADIAHELRTPLSVMQGRLEGMLDGVYPRDEPHVTQVLEDTRLLARLVDDLRTLAHSESGSLTLQKEPTDIGVLVDEALASLKPEAEAREVTIRAEVPVEVPLMDVDPLRIREVVLNLVSNAVRYAGAGKTVDVTIAVQPHALTLRVRDNGPGIAPEDLPHIFDRFHKGAASSGSGLGLTIAHNLVTAHGGTVTAESHLGAGTTVIVVLPTSSG